jgi:hypothetical protein
MRTRFLVAGALWALLLLATVRAQDAGNKAPANSSSSSSTDANTLKSGEYFGKLVAPPASDGSFTIRIEHYEPKDAAAATKAANDLNAAVQKAQQLEQQVAANSTPQRLNALQKAYDQVHKQQARQRDFYNLVYKEIDFHAANDATIRFLQPPVVYDDKGERKKFSKSELEEMHGTDPSVPGYAAKTTDLQASQVIRVSLRPARSTSDDKAAASDKDKDKPAPKMEATMIVIVVPEDMTPVDQDNKDSGKKKGK